MKSLFTSVLLLLFCVPAYSGNESLEQYISSFDYEARKDMKINSKRLISLLKEEKAQLIDIRFKEEHAAWSVGASKSIPLNELPSRLKEI
ncbi:MAG: rhodanese-like domain-containing protein, partial [Gammaproteobacteria bacterium]